MANPYTVDTPSKTINTFNSKWNASALPIVYTIQNDKYPIGQTLQNYYTEVDIYVNNALVSTIRQVPDGNNITTIDIRKFVTSKMNLNVLTEGFDSGATVSFYIEGKEVFTDSNGDVFENIIDGEVGSENIYYSALSALQFGSNLGGNLYDYLVSSEKSVLAKWMTSFGRGQIIDFFGGTLSIICESDFDFNVDFFDINGNVISTTTESYTVNDVGVYRFNTSSLNLSEDVYYIEAYITIDGDRHSEPYFINVDISPCVIRLAAPTDLLLVSSNEGTAVISATSNSNGLEEFFEWRISESDDFSNIIESGTSEKGELNPMFEFSEINPNTTYYVTVRAVSDGSARYITSNWSEVFQLLPVYDFGLALSFGNGTEIIDLGNQLNGETVSDDYAFAFWVKSYESGPERQYVFRTRNGGNTEGFGFWMENPDGSGIFKRRIRVFYETGNVVTLFRTDDFGEGLAPFNGEWARVVITRESLDATTFRNKVYVNGEVKNIEGGNDDFFDMPKSAAPSVFNVENTIGVPSNVPEADIDDLMFIEGVVGQADIDADYAGGNGSSYFRTNFNRVFDFDFNKNGAIGSGDNTSLSNVVDDLSGNSNDGQMNNFNKIGVISNWVDH